MSLFKQFYVTGLVILVGLITFVTVSTLTTSSHVVAVSNTPAGKIDLIPLHTSPARAAISEINTAAESVNSEQAPAPAQETEALPVQNQSPASPKPAQAPKPVQNPALAKPVAKATTASTPTNQVISCSGAFVVEFLCLLNNYRTNKGLGKLSGNSNLSKVALGHSEWMNSTGTFSHTGINGSRLGDRCKAAGITCRAENLARNASSPQNLLDMWIASPSHNKNLLGSYSTAGIGISGSYITLLMN